MQSTTNPEEINPQSQQQAHTVEATEENLSPESPANDPNWKNEYLELLAEFQNHQKRMAKSHSKLLEVVTEQVVKSMVPILQDLWRALAEAEKSATHSTMIDSRGVHLIYDKLHQALEKQGLQLMEVSVGDVFDSERHEALIAQPTQDEALKGHVLEVVEKGYLLYGKVIRVAKVITGA